MFILSDHGSGDLSSEGCVGGRGRSDRRTLQLQFELERDEHAGNGSQKDAILMDLAEILGRYSFHRSVRWQQETIDA